MVARETRRDRSGGPTWTTGIRWSCPCARGPWGLVFERREAGDRWCRTATGRWMCGPRNARLAVQVEKCLCGNAVVLAHASQAASRSFWPGAFTVPSPLTYMYRVVVVMPRRCARSRALVLRSAMARIAMPSVATSILRGLPPKRPLARAAAKPARVRLAIGSRSNSAKAAKMPKTRRPLAVVVSISAPAAGEHAQAGAAAVQLVDRRRQLLQVASRAVQLPDDEGVAWLQGFQTGLQAGTVVMASRGAVLVDTLLADAGTQRSVMLQIKGLSTVRLGDARAADQHGMHPHSE